jgi:hypothetical protein
LGSNVHPSPGTSLPTLAYIGSSDLSDSFVGDASALILDRNRATAAFFGSRLLRQTLLFPDAKSSMVRLVSTEVMFSATTSRLVMPTDTEKAPFDGAFFWCETVS